MTLFQIKSFIQIVESGSVSKAAEELYVSQSSLSKQLHALEDELGFSLFVRKGRRLRLTTLGQSYLSFALDVQESYNEFQSKIHPDEDKQLVVVMIPSFADMFLPTLNKFMEENPSIDVILHEYNENDLANAMIEFKGHIAMSWDSSIADFGPEYGKLELFSSQLCIGMTEENPLASKAQLDFSELKGQKFIMLNQPVRQNYLINKCKEYSFVPHITHNICTPDTFYHFVRENEGVAFIQKIDPLPDGSPRLKVPALDGLTLVPLKEDIHSSVVMYYQSKSLPAIARKFLRFMLEKTAPDMPQKVI